MREYKATDAANRDESEIGASQARSNVTISKKINAKALRSQKRKEECNRLHLLFRHNFAHVL
jgi:hypothetical protein